MFITQRGPNIAAGDVSAYLNHRTDGTPFAVVKLGHDADVHVHTPEQADALIAAAVEAKRLLDPPCASVAPRTGRACTETGDHGRHRNGMVVWEDEPDDAWRLTAKGVEAADAATPPVITYGPGEADYDDDDMAAEL